MRKTLQFIFYVALISACDTNADSIEDICSRGESYSFMELCALKEQTAKARVDTMGISDPIFNYCARIADGSYSLIETCILRELRAKPD